MKLKAAILFLIFAIPVAAQYSIHQELKFIEHLVNQGDFDDAIFYINQKNKDYPFPIRDSLNYYKGWCHYSMKELQWSAASLLNVSKNSSFFYKSRFFAAYSYSHMGILPTSDNILETLETEGHLEGLKYFELSGNALLKRNFTQFEKLINTVPPIYEFAYSKEKLKLIDFAKEIKNRRQKNPWVGGLMSAFVPGSGKIYAGKTGEGIASFIIVTASGLTAIENYNKLGSKNAKTWLFGTLFAILYSGNIYGSIFTVKLTNEEFNHEMDHKILFNMHIPLRNIFN